MEAATSSRTVPRDPIEFSQPRPGENTASRLFRAPPERVFRLFTSPATIAYVCSPDPSLVTIETLDFRPGGAFSILVRDPKAGPIRFSGEYREVDPPRRVVNTFRVSLFPKAFATETDVFERVGNFTRLTVRWKYEQAEDANTMWGPDAFAGITAMWDNVARLLEEETEDPAAARRKRA